ncbi:MAG: hypothetical protein HY362_03290 [Candidatus Aenigmarchaeota archaeon]|nr:hypothetical protein [Candidatus Aenigmarchaeota archaeon]
MGMGGWGIWFALKTAAEQETATKAKYEVVFPIADILRPAEYERFINWVGHRAVGVGYVNPDPTMPQMQLAVGKLSTIAPTGGKQDISLNFDGEGTVLSAGSIFHSGTMELPKNTPVYTGKADFLREVRKLDPLVNSRRVVREPYEAFMKKVEESRFPFQ